MFGTAKNSSTDELHGTVQGCPKAYAVQASASIRLPLAEISSLDQPSVLSQPVIIKPATGVPHPSYFVTSLVSNQNTRIIQRQMLPDCFLLYQVVDPGKVSLTLVLV
jgi:hypothetical protein